MENNKLKLLKNLTLLLVEEDDELKNNLKETLSFFFKRIITATNGTEALIIYQNNNIDMVISDYVMPIMNGYDLCKQIRNDNNKIPLVIMSNYTDNEKLLKSITLELSEYLIKPIEYNQLTSTLLNMINKLERSNLSYFEINNSIKYDFFRKELINKNENKVLKLSKSEIVILELLIKNQNSIITNEIIEYNLSNTQTKSEQAIKSVIFRLRVKIGKENILNVQSIGYILRNTVESEKI